MAACETVLQFAARPVVGYVVAVVQAWHGWLATQFLQLESAVLLNKIRQFHVSAADSNKDGIVLLNFDGDPLRSK